MPAICNAPLLRRAACAASLSFAAAAIAAESPGGQWVGNSQLAGAQHAGKTTLVLGAADSDDSTLRIEDRNTCVLRQGRYASGSGGTWSLSFKHASGGDACARLARGTFNLQQGSSPRTLQLDVRYPGPDGQPNQRHGLLSRYP